MGIKNKIVSLLSTLAVVSTMGIGVYAQETTSTQAYRIVDAPSGAVYSVYRDVSKNYIYDDFEDTFVVSFTCDADGTGYVSNLEAGDYVAVLDTDYSDSKVEYHREYAFTYDGKTATVQEAFSTTKTLSLSTVSTTDDSTVNIQYDVPLYKQSGPDATKWSYMRINGSSDTMGYVGCLICAFAMVRSYEVGYNIYPNEMAVSYSSSKNVGVSYAAANNCCMSVPNSSSNYGWSVYGYTKAYGGNGEIANNVVGNASLYKVLYQKLQNGPVIFGGYSTPNGRGSSNHWVVVTGYHGDGQNFSAEDFTICDSSYNNGYNRTTLAEYSQSYPYWDRLIYNSTSKVLKYDVNLDGEVNLIDLLQLKRHILGISELMGLSITNCDINGNGYLDHTDALNLKKRLLSD